MAQKLEGVARHASTHAAGVIISRDPLTDHVPLQRATKGDLLMTQYDMNSVARLGLLKMDFLGLTNLTILDQAIKMIRETRGVEIDLQRLPLDDQPTYALLGSGDTTGIFQLEGRGMTRWLRELKPDRIEDVMAMVALFRPGPMANIPAYIRRKHGQEPVTYLHPLLEPVLKETYGVMVYQEDIMTVAQAVAGLHAGRGRRPVLRDPQEDQGPAAGAAREVRRGRPQERRAGARSSTRSSSSSSRSRGTASTARTPPATG